MIVMIDNYDSFTYNVYQAMASLYNNIKVYRTPKHWSSLRAPLIPRTQAFPLRL